MKRPSMPPPRLRRHHVIAVVIAVALVLNYYLW